MSEGHLRSILKSVGHPLQPGTSAQCAGAWRTGSAAGTWDGPEVRIPTSIGGGCARAREIGAGRLASRVFACNGTGGCVMGDRETDGRVRRATFLRSTGIRPSCWIAREHQSMAQGSHSCRHREFSLARLATHMGQLARAERNASLRGSGDGRVGDRKQWSGDTRIWPRHTFNGTRNLCPTYLTAQIRHRSQKKRGRRIRQPSDYLVGGRGLEPRTNGLRVRCSTS